MHGFIHDRDESMLRHLLERNAAVNATTKVPRGEG